MFDAQQEYFCLRLLLIKGIMVAGSHTEEDLDRPSLANATLLIAMKTSNTVVKCVLMLVYSSGSHTFFAGPPLSYKKNVRDGSAPTLNGPRWYTLCRFDRYLFQLA